MHALLWLQSRDHLALLGNLNFGVGLGLILVAVSSCHFFFGLDGGAVDHAFHLVDASEIGFDLRLDV